MSAKTKLMMGKLVKVFAIIGILAVACFFVAWRVEKSRWATFEGKTVDHWFREFCAAESRYQRPVQYPMGGKQGSWISATSTDMSAWFKDKSAQALRALGTNAAVFLAKVIVKPERPWAPVYGKFYWKLPQALKSVAPHPPAAAFLARRQAVYALDQLGPNGFPAVPTLIEGLKTTNKVDRTMIVLALRHLPHEENDFDPVLKDLIEGGELSAAVDLIQNLNLRSPIAGTALAKAIADGDPETQRRAFRSIPYFGTNNVLMVPALLGVLTNSNSEIRYCATSALADIGLGAREAVPALRSLTNDSSTMVQNAAHRALRSIELQNR